MLTNIAMILLDLFVLSGTLVLSVAFRYLLGGIFTVDNLHFYILFSPLVLMFIAVYWMLGLYPGLLQAKSEELKYLSIGSTFVIAIIVTLTFFSRDIEIISRTIIFIWWGLLLIFMPLSHSLFRRIMAKRPWWGLPVVIFGSPEANAGLLTIFSANPLMGIKVRAVVPVSMRSESCQDIRQKLFIYAYAKPKPMLLCSLALDQMPLEAREMLLTLENHFRRILLLPPEVLNTLRLDVLDLGGIIFMQTSTNLLDPMRQIIKRGIDLLIIAVFAPLIILVMAFLALGIRLESSGRIFYKQARLGKRNKTFYIYKFRTMRQDAEAVLSAYLEKDPDLRREWEERHKLLDDPRVTRMGRFLRKTSLDELPQIWNVLNGEMSLVGPRPIVQEEVSRYAAAYDLYQRTRPGVTGFWQISGRNDTSYESRVAMDVYYTRNWSIWMDIYILARTIGVVLRCKGAY